MAPDGLQAQALQSTAARFQGDLALLAFPVPGGFLASLKLKEEVQAVLFGHLPAALQDGLYLRPGNAPRDQEVGLQQAIPDQPGRSPEGAAVLVQEHRQDPNLPRLGAFQADPP